jgi:hypothetical protein
MAMTPIFAQTCSLTMIKKYEKLRFQLLVLKTYFSIYKIPKKACVVKEAQ